MDHVQGLFPLRWGVGDKIPVYGPPDEQGCDDLFKHPGLLDFQSHRRAVCGLRSAGVAGHAFAAESLEINVRLFA